MKAKSLLLASLLLAAGCDGELEDIFGTGGDDDDEEGDGSTGGGSDMLERDSFSGTSNNSGLLQVEVDLSGDQTAFLVTAESSSYPTLERVLDPSGNEVLHWEDWWTSNESLTYAFFPWGQAMAFNWPVREEDGPLESGTWTVELATITPQGNYDGNQDVEVTVHKKADGAFGRSDVRVRIIWADGVGGDSDVVDAVEQAVERWREIWGEYGLTVDESYHDSSLDPDLGFWYSGSGAVESNAEQYDGQELFLIVGETIDGDTYTYGVAGGIPGSIEPNRFSFVVLSWLAHAGGNGQFSEDEIRLMGETMAHESGHYMGLFHPVESDYASYDALDDTPACGSANACENQLGDNLMFPYPLCYGQSCDPQGELSDGQTGVSQRYTGAL